MEKRRGENRRDRVEVINIGGVITHQGSEGRFESTCSQDEIGLK